MKPALLLFALALGGCGMVEIVSKVSSDDGEGPQVKGTGRSIMETRKAQAISAAEFSGALTVEVRQGAPTLTVEAQKEILPHIKTEFKSGRLHVWTVGSMSTNGPMKVRLTTPNLESVEVSGATTVDAAKLSGRTLKIVLSGASKLEANGQAERLEVELSGASEAHLKGIDAQTVKVEVSGASKAWITAHKNLRALASGASQVRYYGKPEINGNDVTGASSVQAG